MPDRLVRCVLSHLFSTLSKHGTTQGLQCTVRHRGIGTKLMGTIRGIGTKLMGTSWLMVVWVWGGLGVWVRGAAEGSGLKR